jgi:hypothetical protein
MLKNLALLDARVGMYSESLNPLSSKASECSRKKAEDTAEYPRNLIFRAPFRGIASHKCG